MKKKYNLALTPVLKSKKFIEVAQKFSDVSDKYLLEENSFPHVTLYQFEAEEKEIDGIWQEVIDVWKQKPIDLELGEFSYITFDNDIYWISLLPRNSEVLHTMHALIAEILRLPTKKSYDPHLTLVNTKNNHYQSEIERIAKAFTPIADTFKLSLGRSDEIGQVIEIIFQSY